MGDICRDHRDDIWLGRKEKDIWHHRVRDPGYPGTLCRLDHLFGSLVPAGILDAADPMGDGQLFSPDELPVEGRLLPHYWGMVINGILALAAMVAEISRKKAAVSLKIITGIFAILIFFLMMGVVKS